MGVQILIVDDHADSRLLMADLLTARGFDVAAVASGRESLAAIQRFRPRLVIMDLQMPEMDGFATLAALREEDPEMPVLAVSGHVLPDDERRIQTAGFDAALGKPLDLRALVNQVERLTATVEEPG